MPSHLSHLIFAQDVAATYLPEFAETLDSRTNTALSIGAQGPDVFLHNRRRRPAGINYGIILHRKGSGVLCGALVELGRQNTPFQSVFGAYTVGYVTHVVLDRLLHPFINVRAGWREPGRPETYGYGVHHVFLERVIDTLLVERRRGCRPSDMGFAETFAATDPAMFRLAHVVKRAIRRATRRGGNDSLLGKRMINAFIDARDYYSAIETPDLTDAAARLTSESEELPFWMGVFHPPSLPTDIDFANDARTAWCHPCTGVEYSSESLDDIYERALAHAGLLVQATRESWENRRPATGLPAGTAEEIGDTAHFQPAPGTVCTTVPPAGMSLERLLGNGDLSDERLEGEPCRKHYAEVLDFPKALRHVRSYIIRNS